ncbi:DUF402 domain-containing protein [Mobilicoccus pelagius]|uniref:DUF402 domain-containing protein n=1 Tax=Mobilicoccus pelagius NBRC 104925 TaxID=1089455 RepID=H5URF0_9MICO|nr:DUF402 domain-containing protein [Mobilicoccus pelagius]GAB48308.1 hypothetical protein MOPEL_071_00230 [Mobilicoccus pelagius NBRC 104925]
MDAGGLSPAELPFGARVHAVFTKYDGSPHWEYDLVVVGVDEYGVWVGGAPGGSIARPGLEFTSDAHWVTLYPHDGMWVATFNDSAGTFSSRIYVDVTTQATWWHRPDGVLSVSAVDLDLDVIRRFSGELFVDDEDEFDEHRREMSYPADVVEGARAATAWLVDRMGERAEPFEDVAESWLTLCRERVASDERGRAVLTSSAHVEDEPVDAGPSWVSSSQADEAPGTPARVGDPFVAEPSATLTDEETAAPADAPVVDGPVSEGSVAEPAAVSSPSPPAEEDLLAVWSDEAGDAPLVEVDEDDEPAVEVERDGGESWSGHGRSGGDRGVVVADVSHDLEDIDTTPVDPSEVTGVLLTTETGRESPLYFDGRPIEPEELDLSPELVDHLRDWSDRWTRDFDPVRGWQPRAVIADYEALGRWLGRRVKDEVGGLAVTVQLAHLGRSSLFPIAAAEDRPAEVVELDADAPGELPVRGDVVTRVGTVGCFTSEVNARLLDWRALGGADEAEADELRRFMSDELGPDYEVR